MSALRPLDIGEDITVISDVETRDAASIDLTSTEVSLHLGAEAELAPEPLPKVIAAPAPTDDPAMRVVYCGLVTLAAILTIATLLALA